MTWSGDSRGNLPEGRGVSSRRHFDEKTILPRGALGASPNGTWKGVFTGVQPTRSQSWYTSFTVYKLQSVAAWFALFVAVVVSTDRSNAQFFPSRMIVGFDVEPSEIEEGGSARLTWEVQYATRVTIEPGIGPVPFLADKTVSPRTTVEYTLTAWSGEKPYERSRVTLTVIPKPQEQPKTALEPTSQNGKTPKEPGQVNSSSDILVACGGTLVIALMLVVSHLSPNPTDSQWFVFRVTIALAAACIGAVIPGWISIGLPAIRAGGAIALFVLVYWFNPPRLVTPQSHRSGPRRG